ncbi:hypothetical protein ABW20_dc0102041 [Dactylellina cionopaga]|nr:hypothetical protein ABW20_dc0102041 [Dactylellina cionopaga]
MKPRRKYDMVASHSSDYYANPAFRDSGPPRILSKTDPLPFAATFDHLAHSLLPEEPHLPGPPDSTPTLLNSTTNSNTTPRIDVTMATSPPLVSPISPKIKPQRFSNRSSLYSASIYSTRSISSPTSPVADKRPSRFHSDFSKLKPRTPDPSFKSHRRTFSQEQTGYRTSAFREEVIEEDDDSAGSVYNRDINNANSHGADGVTTREAGQPFQSIPLEHQPNGLGLSYVPVDDGNSVKDMMTYSNVPPDDDYSSDYSSSIKKKKPSTNWLSIMILILCVYSTLGSIFFFVVAVARPRYGTKISTTSRFKPQDAQLVSAIFSKTTADTLVSPKLAWGSPQTRNLTGFASTSYATNTYKIEKCQTIISDAEDPIGEGYLVPVAKATCDGILSAGRGYRDLADWNELWAEAKGQSFPDPLKRPAAPSSLELVNYAGAWMSVTKENGVNRAVMAMPHPGVIASTKNSSLNGILQPEQVGSGYGSFIIKGAVANPAVDVTCAPINASHIEWYLANEDKTRNGTFDPQVQQVFNFTNNATFFFDTSIYTQPVLPYAAPRFAKAPIEKNSIIATPLGDPSVYLLTRAPGLGAHYVMCSMKSFVTPNCSSEFQAFESSGNATANCRLDNPLAFKEVLRGQNVSTIDYPIEGAPGAPVQDLPYPFFKDIAMNVLLATSLNTGVTDGNASITRFLSQLAVDTRNGDLDPSRPTLAEALAVLLGNAIITSAVDSVFTTYFPYGPDVPLPYVEYFTAEVATIEYTSGAGSGWKPLFYVVLAGVLIMNVFCLIYFSCVREGFVTDWTEVQNLFCVVMDGGALKGGATDSKIAPMDMENEAWKGTGGTGPIGPQYKVGFWFTEKQGRWYVTDGRGKKGVMTTGYERMV